MSAIASFYLLNTSSLEELKQHANVIIEKSWFRKKTTDNFWDYLANNATALNSFDGSGYLYTDVLVYLQQEKNIDLLTNQYDATAKELAEKRGSSLFLFSHDQKSSFLTLLDPALFSSNEIQKFNEELSGDVAQETTALMIEAIKILRDNLSKVENEKQILLMIIG